MRSFVAIGTASMALAGCASVSFSQLEPNLSAKDGAPEGAVYYMPKPYLLVTQLPFPPVISAKADTALAKSIEEAMAGKSSGDSTNKESSAGVSSNADKGSEESPVSTVGSDQSFGGSSQGYLLKIIYLPDMSRPMSFAIKRGIGTASLKPTLQNGWMLTGMDASQDSKTAEILTALAPLVTAIKTPGKAADGGAKGESNGTDNKLLLSLQVNRPILRPGLYEFQYDKQNYNLTGICAVTFFSASGTEPATGDGACNPTKK